MLKSRAVFATCRQPAFVAACRSGVRVADCARPWSVPRKFFSTVEGCSVSDGLDPQARLIKCGPGFAVFEKPAGMPISGQNGLDFNSWLKERHDESEVDTCAGRSLDAEFSGALFVAFSRQVAFEAASLWESGEAVEIFTVILRGKLRLQDTIEINARLCKPSEGSTAWRLASNRAEGREACSLFRGLSHGTYAGEPCTLAEVRPVTRHPQQLQLHCAAAGHPIVGDCVHDADRRLDWRYEGNLPAPRLMAHRSQIRLPLRSGVVQVAASRSLESVLQTEPDSTVYEPQLLEHRIARRSAGAWEKFAGGLNPAFVDDTPWDRQRTPRRAGYGAPFGPPEWDPRSRPKRERNPQEI